MATCIGRGLSIKHAQMRCVLSWTLRGITKKKHRQEMHFRLPFFGGERWVRARFMCEQSV